MKNNDDILCVFACLAYHLYQSDYLKKKGDIKGIHTLADKLAKKFYADEYKFEEYKGFDTVNETERLCEVFEINASYYSYNEVKNDYKQEMLIHKFEFKDTINILLHAGTTLRVNICNYAMLITNIEKLTG